MKRLIGRLPSHATVAAYLALFVALGGTAYAVATVGSSDIQNNAIHSWHIAPGQVKKSDIHTNAIDSSKVVDGSLSLADLNVTVTTVTLPYGGLSAGTCTFVHGSVPGLTSGEGLLAYSDSSMDNRLMIDGVESVGSGGEEVAVHLCNHTTSTNLGAGSFTVVLLRFP